MAADQLSVRGDISNAITALEEIRRGAIIGPMTGDRSAIRSRITSGNRFGVARKGKLAKKEKGPKSGAISVERKN